MLLDLDKINAVSIAAKDSEGRQITYGEILNFTQILTHKIKERSLIFLLTQNDVGGIAWVMATILSGNVPLILNAHIEPSLLQNLIDTYNPNYICIPSELERSKPCQFKKYDYKIINIHNIDCKLHPSLSHLLPTSGSTGSPKLVRHKYANIESAALNISSLFRLTKLDRPLMVLPLYYTMGLSIVFSHLKVGATVLITNRKMTDPVFWKFLKEEKATSFTGVPFSYEILDKMRFCRMKLPDLTLLTQGGGKMPEDLNRKFVEYCIENGKRWIATYGQSEGTARMAWLPEEYSLSKMGSIGIAVPNGRLSLRDEKGKEITDSPAVGEMCYEGKNVTMGYAYCYEDLALGDVRNGFLATGDIAFRDSDGFYYIKGRIGRFLKLFGNRIGLDECENILRRSISGECACTGSDEKLIIYITDKKDYPIVHSSIMDATKLPATIIEVRLIEEMPKNEAGKILYSKLENH